MILPELSPAPDAVKSQPLPTLNRLGSESLTPDARRAAESFDRVFEQQSRTASQERRRDPADVDRAPVDDTPRAERETPERAEVEVEDDVEIDRVEEIETDEEIAPLAEGEDPEVASIEADSDGDVAPVADASDESVEMVEGVLDPPLMVIEPEVAEAAEAIDAEPMTLAEEVQQALEEAVAALEALAALVMPITAGGSGSGSMGQGIVDALTAGAQAAMQTMAQPKGDASAKLAMPAQASGMDASAMAGQAADAAMLAATSGEASADTSSEGDSQSQSQANLAAASAKPATGTSAAAAPTPTFAAPTAGVDATAPTNPLQPALAPTAGGASNAANGSTANSPAADLDAMGPNDRLNSARLTRAINTAVNQQGGGMTLRLTPNELGTVRIQLQMNGTSVNAQFHAETAAGQTLLNRQLGQLRTALEAQGLQVERVSVQPLQTNNTNTNTGQQQDQQAANDGRARQQFSGQNSAGQQPGGDANPDDPNAPVGMPAGFDLDALLDGALS